MSENLHSYFVFIDVLLHFLLEMNITLITILKENWQLWTVLVSSPIMLLWEESMVWIGGQLRNTTMVMKESLINEMSEAEYIKINIEGCRAFRQEPEE